MTLLRLFARRIYSSWTRTALEAPSSILATRRCFSALSPKLESTKNDTKQNYEVRYFEQDDGDQTIDRTNSDKETEALKARIAELEKDLQKYAGDRESEGKPLREGLDEIFASMPEEMRPESVTREELQAMIDTDDPRWRDFVTEDDLEIIERYDAEAVFQYLPEELRATLTKEQLQQKLDDEDAEIIKYIPASPNPQSDTDPIHDEEVDLDARLRKDLFDELEGPLHVKFPEHAKIHLDAFNRVMKEVASQSKDHRSIGQLWTKYELCKRHVPGFLDEIPSQVWRIVWLSQWTGNLVPESRKQHLWILVNDLVEVERPLDHDQTLVYIEYLFSNGSRTQAMKLWRRKFSELRDDNPKKDDFRDLGVRLHVEAGLLAEAQQLIFGLERKAPVRAEDVAIIIAAWARKADEQSLRIAWSLYLDMRECLGKKIKLDDYDHISLTFLEAGRSNLALAVFKDMVLSTRARSKNPEMQSKSMSVLQRLQNQATSKEELDRISLETLASIPKQLENKYFYASWIKRLIGLGEIDATVQILELMFQRGIRPDARHINGIIGAWLRGAIQDKHQMALQIAWSMVKERLKFIAQRGNDPSTKAINNIDEGKLVPPYISRNLPSANIETFCLLLLYYERRSMTASVAILKQYLTDAEIAPNSFFMNHLLFAELRKHNVSEAWHIYKNMSRTVSSDLESFAALWSCEKIFTSGRSLSAPEFPRSRSLFARMVNWYKTLHGRNLKQTKTSFSADLYNEIIRCFCFQKDISGTVIALYALRDLFSFYPNPETERLILIQLSRIGEGAIPRTKRRSKRFSSNRSSVQDFNKITKIATLVKEDRVSALREMGIEDDQLQGRQRKEEDLWRLAQVLRVSMRWQAGVEFTSVCPAEEELGLVAREMGVEGLESEMDAPSYEHGLEKG